MARTRPPLNPIRAFETAARHLSFTVAGEELGITQIAGAGRSGCSRTISRCRCSSAAPVDQDSPQRERAFPAASRALDEINAAVASLSMRGRRDVLVVQTYSTFAQRWLIPRLWRFHQRLPTVEIRLGLCGAGGLRARADSCRHPATQRPDGAV